MIRYDTLFKHIAFALVVCLVLHDAALASPNMGGAAPLQSTPVLSTTNELAHDALHVATPHRFGTLRKTHIGNNGKFIILIEDAHVNYSGQISIAGMIDFFRERYGTHLVLTEGSSRDVSLDAVRSLAAPEIWKIAAKQMLRMGVIAGEEYLNLTTPGPLALIGIERKGLYLRSLHYYAQMVRDRDSVMAELRRSRAALEFLKNRMYPKSVRMFEDGLLAQQGISEGIDFVLETARQHGVSEDPFPELQQYARLSEHEKYISDHIQTSLKSLITQLESSEAAEEVRAITNGMGRVMINPVQTGNDVRRLGELARVYGVSMPDVDVVEQYAALLNEMSHIDPMMLMQEKTGLEDQIYRKLLLKEDARRLRALDRYLTLLEKAYRIELSAAEFKLIQLNRSDFDTQGWQAFINGLMIKYGERDTLIPFTDRLDRSYKRVVNFYRLVYKRDKYFGDHTRKVMEKQGVTAAMLVVGGYHTEHLTSIFRNKGYSYAVFTPHVTEETDRDLYERLLLKALPVRRQEPVSHPSPGVAELIKPEGLLESPSVTVSRLYDVKLYGNAQQYIRNGGASGESIANKPEPSSPPAPDRNVSGSRMSSRSKKILIFAMAGLAGVGAVLKGVLDHALDLANQGRRGMPVATTGDAAKEDQIPLEARILPAARTLMDWDRLAPDHPPVPEAVQSIFTRLQSDDPEVRGEAVLSLGALAKQSIDDPGLKQMLQPIMTALIRSWDDPEIRVRYRALNGIKEWCIFSVEAHLMIRSELELMLEKKADPQRVFDLAEAWMMGPGVDDLALKRSVDKGFRYWMAVEQPFILVRSNDVIEKISEYLSDQPYFAMIGVESGARTGMATGSPHKLRRPMMLSMAVYPENSESIPASSSRWVPLSAEDVSEYIFKSPLYSTSDKRELWLARSGAIDAMKDPKKQLEAFVQLAKDAAWLEPSEDIAKKMVQTAQQIILNTNAPDDADPTTRSLVTMDQLTIFEAIFHGTALWGEAARPVMTLLDGNRESKRLPRYLSQSWQAENGFETSPEIHGTFCVKIYSAVEEFGREVAGRNDQLKGADLVDAIYEFSKLGSTEAERARSRSMADQLMRTFVRIRPTEVRRFVLPDADERLEAVRDGRVTAYDFLDRWIKEALGGVSVAEDHGDGAGILPNPNGTLLAIHTPYTDSYSTHHAWNNPRALRLLLSSAQYQDEAINTAAGWLLSIQYAEGTMGGLRDDEGEFVLLKSLDPDIRQKVLARALAMLESDSNVFTDHKPMPRPQFYAAAASFLGYAAGGSQDQEAIVKRILLHGALHDPSATLRDAEAGVSKKRGMYVKFYCAAILLQRDFATLLEAYRQSPDKIQEEVFLLRPPRMEVPGAEDWNAEYTSRLDRMRVLPLQDTGVQIKGMFGTDHWSTGKFLSGAQSLFDSPREKIIRNLERLPTHTRRIVLSEIPSTEWLRFLGDQTEENLIALIQLMEHGNGEITSEEAQEIWREFSGDRYDPQIVIYQYLRRRDVFSVQDFPDTVKVEDRRSVLDFLARVANNNVPNKFRAFYVRARGGKDDGKQGIDNRFVSGPVEDVYRWWNQLGLNLDDLDRPHGRQAFELLCGMTVDPNVIIGASEGADDRRRALHKVIEVFRSDIIPEVEDYIRVLMNEGSPVESAIPDDGKALRSKIRFAHDLLLSGESKKLAELAQSDPVETARLLIRIKVFYDSSGSAVLASTGIDWLAKYLEHLTQVHPGRSMDSMVDELQSLRTAPSAEDYRTLFYGEQRSPLTIGNIQDANQLMLAAWGCELIQGRRSQDGNSSPWVNLTHLINQRENVEFDWQQGPLLRQFLQRWSAYSDLLLLPEELEVVRHRLAEAIDQFVQAQTLAPDSTNGEFNVDDFISFLLLRETFGEKVAALDGPMLERLRTSKHVWKGLMAKAGGYSNEFKGLLFGWLFGRDQDLATKIILSSGLDEVEALLRDRRSLETLRQELNAVPGQNRPGNIFMISLVGAYLDQAGSDPKGMQKLYDTGIDLLESQEFIDVDAQHLYQTVAKFILNKVGEIIVQAHRKGDPLKDEEEWIKKFEPLRPYDIVLDLEEDAITKLATRSGQYSLNKMAQGLAGSGDASAPAAVQIRPLEPDHLPADQWKQPFQYLEILNSEGKPIAILLRGDPNNGAGLRMEGEVSGKGVTHEGITSRNKRVVLSLPVGFSAGRATTDTLAVNGLIMVPMTSTTRNDGWIIMDRDGRAKVVNKQILKRSDLGPMLEGEPEGDRDKVFNMGKIEDYVRVHYEIIPKNGLSVVSNMLLIDGDKRVQLNDGKDSRRLFVQFEDGSWGVLHMLEAGSTDAATALATNLKSADPRLKVDKAVYCDTGYFDWFTIEWLDELGRSVHKKVYGHRDAEKRSTHRIFGVIIEELRKKVSESTPAPDPAHPQAAAGQLWKADALDDFLKREIMLLHNRLFAAVNTHPLRHRFIGNIKRNELHKKFNVLWQEFVIALRADPSFKGMVAEAIGSRIIDELAVPSFALAGTLVTEAGQGARFAIPSRMAGILGQELSPPIESSFDHSGHMNHQEDYQNLFEEFSSAADQAGKKIVALYERSIAPWFDNPEFEEMNKPYLSHEKFEARTFDGTPEFADDSVEYVVFVPASHARDHQQDHPKMAWARPGMRVVMVDRTDSDRLYAPSVTFALAAQLVTRKMNIESGFPDDKGQPDRRAINDFMATSTFRLSFGPAALHDPPYQAIAWMNKLPSPEPQTGWSQVFIMISKLPVRTPLSYRAALNAARLSILTSAKSA